MKLAVVPKIFRSVRKYGILVLLFGVIAAGTLYYLYLHRRPFTQNAFVVANTRIVNALVPGYISHIHVVNNQFVRKGQALLTIYRPIYERKLEETAHALRAEEALVRSLDAQIRASEAVIRQYEAERANAKYLSKQANIMYSGLAVSQAYAEERYRSMQAFDAKLDSAKASCESLRHEKTRVEASCDKLRSSLELCRIYLDQTIVRALADGFVTNMYLSEGAYANAGEALFAFIDSEEWFLQANFQETELSELREGQTARIWLWQYPQREFTGRVEQINWGVERRRTDANTGMPLVEKENQWLLLPQRFPVQIRVLDVSPELPLHPGGSAFVQLDTPAHPFRQFFWQLFQVNILGDGR